MRTNGYAHLSITLDGMTVAEDYSTRAEAYEALSGYVAGEAGLCATTDTADDDGAVGDLARDSAPVGYWSVLTN